MCDVCHSRVSRRAAVLGLAAAGLSMAAPRALADRIYTVQKGENLTAIAEKHGLTVKALAAHNGLKDANDIKAGQRLRIPAEDPAPQLPPGVKTQIDNVRVKSGKWRYIVIHHSGTDMGSAAGMDAYHRKERHMENGLAYHFVIGNGNRMEDGEIYVGNRWLEQLDGGHLASEYLNSRALGICLVGNFEVSRPTGRQMENLHALVAHLLKKCRLSVSALKSHQQINTVYTRCPGRLFPMPQLVKQLKA